MKSTPVRGGKVCFLFPLVAARLVERELRKSCHLHRPPVDGFSQVSVFVQRSLLRVTKGVK